MMLVVFLLMFRCIRTAAMSSSAVRPTARGSTNALREDIRARA